ncbi:monovalent cation/H+ antiporter subunit A [Caldovatus aquaticus]|uniref:Monovalent cation/H+ antiporter subunit A n=1 Tax=Caldovatus aquaticus TaxID=2865671 RepID=A0ABS7F6G9_9PROT|nr:monovalent cation/H+ antiporter subunit A [Caldovatus aquaticus]MBW8271154.1 monovalent cation/H+ antiporter subunit A [Caldovatus aquaticus]
MTLAGLPLSILALLLGAALVPLLARSGRGVAAWSSAAVLGIAALAVAPLAPAALAGTVTVLRWPWLPEWGLDLAFRLDGLGLLFAILILGIGQLVILYAAYYMPPEDGLGRFFGILLAFAGGMLGVVLSENLLLMVIFWEITSLASFLLIAYRHDASEARIAARMALAVTGGGGLALLAGVLLLGRIAGSLELSAVLAAGEAVRAHPLYPVALALVLLGAFTKSAQFPFHFWLPNAMAAPTPVSAYLHSATMVKAGVFLLARLYPVLSGTELWFALVSGTGAVTLAYGAYVALLKHDLKGLLAYSTISHLGLITLLIGLESPLSTVAAVFHIINHAIFKASLFMAAGIIDHECGTRDMRRINGMFRYMPQTAVLGMVAAAAMAGVPLLNGFLSKEMFFAETLQEPPVAGYAYALPAFATFAGVLSVAYSLRFIHDVFFHGEPVGLPRTPHEPPLWMRVPVGILSLLCLVVGLLPQSSVGALLRTASAAALGGPPPPYELAPWHGFNLPLAMSAVALAGGALWYRFRGVLFDLHERFAPLVGGPAAFERVYNAAAAAARLLMAAMDTGRLRRYVALLLLAALGLGLHAVAGAGLAPPHGAVIPADPVAIGALVALAVGAFGCAGLHRRRPLAVVFASVVGLIVSLTFLRFSAPDLALTQLSVEVVTIVLLLLALRFLPEEARATDAPRRRRLGDAAIAGAGGLGAAALAYALLTRPFETVSGFFVEQSVPGGGGTNVVNVILVDFRGFDTLGEIWVLALAALGAHALLEGLRLRPHALRAASEADRHPVMLAMLMRPLLPLALTVAFHILLRGHNLPGGGFIAGLITGIVLILQYLAVGLDITSARLRVDHLRLFALGLALAAGTGMASMAFGAPFLTSAHGYVPIPLVGRTHLASALAFDLGVYLVVVATVLLVLSELGRLSQRELRPAACGGQG